MPNIKSAKKRMKTSEKAHMRNQMIKSKIKTIKKNFIVSIEKRNIEAGREYLKALCSSLDKAAKRGIIKVNTATRTKTRASNKLRSLAS
jgi:small subunit ribosomal protein S20